MTTPVRRTSTAKSASRGLFNKFYFALPLLLTGCEWGYYLKSAIHHTELLYQQIPVEEALEKDTLSEAEKTKLVLSQDVRKFATENLGLNVRGNYSKFIDLHGKPITYVVSAAQKWKMESHLWKFLFVGLVPYKGFYDEGDARAEIAKLESENLDVYVRGVGAFSTLGMLQDPLVSSMLEEDPEDLVDTIIHESVHATIYIKSSADFNEQLAVYLGGLGTQKFYESREGVGSPTVQRTRDKKADDLVFANFMKEEVQKLSAWYAERETNRDEKLRRARLEEIKTNFQKIRTQLKTNRYAHYFDRPLNNARLMLNQTYMNDLSDFERFASLRQFDFRQIIHDLEPFKKSADPAALLKTVK